MTHFNGPPLSFGGIDYSPRGFRAFHWRTGVLTAQTVPLATDGVGTTLRLVPPVYRPPCEKGGVRRETGGPLPSMAPPASGTSPHGVSDRGRRAALSPVPARMGRGEPG